jgi:hypothetical protein
MFAVCKFLEFYFTGMDMDVDTVHTDPATEADSYTNTDYC